MEIDCAYDTMISSIIKEIMFTVVKNKKKAFNIFNCF